MMDDTVTRQVDVTADGLLRQARLNAQAARHANEALADNLFGGREGELVLTDRQRSTLSTLLRQVVGDIDAAIRWLFVAQLEDNAGTGLAAWSSVTVDDGVGTFLAMQRNGLLRDADLIEAVAQRLYQHQLEKAVRLPERDRWADDAPLDGHSALFDLPLPEASPVKRRITAYYVDRSRRTDTYGNPVLLPGELDPGLYARLHWHVAATLRGMLVNELTGNSQHVDTLIESATSDAIRNALAAAAAPSSAMEAAVSLEGAGLLNAELVATLLHVGEVPLFEAAFAQLSGIRPVLLRRLLYEPGGEAIAVLARSLGMARDMAATIYSLTRPARSGLTLVGGDNTESLLTIFDGLTSEDADCVRAYWARTQSASL